MQIPSLTERFNKELSENNQGFTIQLIKHRSLFEAANGERIGTVQNIDGFIQKICYRW
jgi:hypothetical protein